MKKSNAALALLAAALLVPGCAFAHRAIPLDASGMEYPLGILGNHLEEQVEITHDTIAGLPRAFSKHCRECWRNLMVDPTDL